MDVEAGTLEAELIVGDDSETVLLIDDAVASVFRSDTLYFLNVKPDRLSKTDAVFHTVSSSMTGAEILHPKAAA